MNGTYEDRNGYLRYEDSDRLVHRAIAFKRIYLPNKHLYRYRFKHYEVHHKDGNKKNNEISNLQIVTGKEHQRAHGIDADTPFSLVKWGTTIGSILGFAIMLNEKDYGLLFGVIFMAVIAVLFWSKDIRNAKKLKLMEAGL